MSNDESEAFLKRVPNTSVEEIMMAGYALEAPTIRRQLFNVAIITVHQENFSYFNMLIYLGYRLSETFLNACCWFQLRVVREPRIIKIMFLSTWTQGPKSHKMLSFRTYGDFFKPVPLQKDSSITSTYLSYKNGLFISLSDKAPFVTRHPIQRSNFCRHLYAKLKKKTQLDDAGFNEVLCYSL